MKTNMKVLFISNLYPNSKEPNKAAFNRQKVEALSKYCQIVVVAPIFWFPLKSLRAIQREEEISGIKIFHPRVFYIPKFFRFLYGWFYYLSIKPFIDGLIKEYSFDAIFASWLYPDAWAAVKLAKIYNKPVISEALGTDINVYTKYFLRRILIRQTLKGSDYIIAPSQALREKIVKLGITQDKVKLVYVGVNHQLFFPQDKDYSRDKLGLIREGKIVLFIGNLVKIKGIDYLVKALALANNENWQLLIIGQGPLDKVIRKIIKQYGLDKRVSLLGQVSHNQIPLWLNAADLLCLPSLNEGLPNVILEAMAVGKPVIASNVGGVKEIIDDNSGVLVPPGDSHRLALEIEKVIYKFWDSEYIRSRVIKFSWENNARELLTILMLCDNRSAVG